MFLEILTPESILFSSKVDSVIVPGVNGEFQVLKNHASIVSILKQGTVKIHVHTQEHLVFDELSGHIFPHVDDDKILKLEIKSGTLEVKDNRAIILVG